MSLFVQLEDFETGEFQIPYNNLDSKNNLQKYIDSLEKTYLTDLFGDAMYKDMLLDFDSITKTFTNTNYQAIYDSIYKECSCNSCKCDKTVTQNDGLVDMLKGFIFFHYMRQYSVQRNLQGLKINTAENSIIANISQIGLVNYFNNSIDDYIIIQRHIEKDENKLVNYPLYSTRHRTYITNF